MIALGVLLGYAIALFAAVQIIYENISQSWKFAERHPVFSELIVRAVLVLATFTFAESVPMLGLVLSLIGSVCCSVLAFVFPALIELIVLHNEGCIGAWIWLKNIVILLFAFAGFLFGGAVALTQIYYKFKE